MTHLATKHRLADGSSSKHRPSAFDQAKIRRLGLYAIVLCLGQPCAANTFGEEKRLTNDGRLKQDIAFVAAAPSTSEFVFVVQDRPQQLRMMRHDLKTATSVAVHPDQTRSEFEPAFSADGRYLAFVQSRGNLSLALVVKDLNEGKEWEVPPPGGFSGPRSPAFSADGRHVFYSFADDTQQQIIRRTVQLIAPQTVVSLRGISNWPHAAPDGQRLTFSATSDGNFEIYISKTDGTAPVRLTHEPRQDLRPRFSPDGKRIAFTSHRDGQSEIYVMRADGSDVTRITRNPERDDYPAWHPNGTQLVYLSEREGRFDLFLVDVPKLARSP